MSGGGAGVVGAIISYAAYKRSASPRRLSVEPIVAEIIEALLQRGGSAHRKIIADHIASVRMGKPTVATRELQQEIYEGFQRYLDMAVTRRPAPLLHRPMGPASYRWALTPSGAMLFARRDPSPSRQAH